MFRIWYVDGSLVSLSFFPVDSLNLHSEVSKDCKADALSRQLRHVMHFIPLFNSLFGYDRKLIPVQPTHVHVDLYTAFTMHSLNVLHLASFGMR